MGTPKFKIDFDYKVAIILWGATHNFYTSF